MARLWKRIEGEPYMINPRLGILAMQALNPKGKKRRSMAKHKHGARHMAWVRSFRKNTRRHHKKHYRRNAYPMAGTIAALNPRRRRRHYRRNPGGGFSLFRGGLGLPPVMTIVWTGAGFVATAAAQGFIDTLVPTSWKTNADGTPNLIAKYLEIAASIVLVSWAGKQFLGGGKGALLGIGGGVYMAQQAAHDFIPGMIPGMHAYTPLRAYTPLHTGAGSGVMGGMGQSSLPPSSRGGFPTLATRSYGMPALAAPDQGFATSPNFAGDGAMQVVGERFRRF